MTFPPPSHSAQSSIASGTDKPSSARPARSQQSAWGPAVSQPNLRRGLTPLATNVPGSSTGGPASRRPAQSHSPAPSLSTTSPLTSSFSAVLSSSSRLSSNRNNPSPASTPSFPSLQQTGVLSQQQSGQSHASPKSRSLTPSSVSHLATSTTSTTGGGSGGGGGSGSGSVAGISRNTAFSPLLTGTSINSPTGFSSDKPSSAATSATNAGQSSLSKISVAQVFLLLDSINEKEGKEKWETKAAQIHKLVDSNGMEVFAKYFRRLVSGNAPQIFPGVNKAVENAGNYPLLVQEMQKVSQDLDQAQKIADTIDASEGDIFRDFDLSTFLDHFKLDPIVKVALTLVFKNANKADLRTKADAILTNSTTPFLQSLSSISDTNKDFPSSFIGLTIERFILNPPRNFNNEMKQKLVYAAGLRYQNAELEIPTDVEIALQMFALSDPRLTLVRQIQLQGSKPLLTPEAITETINSVGSEGWSEEQIAGALLFMTLSQKWRQYSCESLLAAVKDHHSAESFNWSGLIRCFDRAGVRIGVAHFLRLYNALLAIAQDVPTLDLQLLWGGDWSNRDSHLSFLSAYLASGIDISKIPNFRSTFPPEIFADASELVRQQAEQAQQSPLRSLDAVQAIFDLVLSSAAVWGLPESQNFVKNILQHDLPIFVCSAFTIPQPWTGVQHNFIIRSFMMFITKRQDGYQFALHGVWKLDRQWVAEQLFNVFTQDPSCTDLIYEHCVEHGWLDYLLEFTNGLAMDLASLAHRKDSFDLDKWVKNAAQKTPVDMGNLLSRFLKIKAEDELRVQRKEQPSPHMVSLAVKTVYALLIILEDYIADHENLTPIQRICLQTYPRLINYGEGFDDIIEANGEMGNAIPEHIDKQMQELFEKMYHEELSLREILELMRRYKTSREPSEQDLFTCMVHSLIDEYHCYNEYPLEALTKTAVMFGGIINFKLISGIPLKVGLGMILDAVRDHQPHESMYKFGVEAIEQLMSRLPEWAGFCSLLLQIPTLQGTTIYRKAEDVLREQGHQPLSEADGADLNGMPDGLAMTNGNVDDLVTSESLPRKFRSLHVDPPSRPDFYHDPDEEVHDKILFILNNVSEQNIKEKLKDLKDVLQEEHHQWFASYLVEQRAKLQPNFQQLYLDLLELHGDKTLWSEVIRETYVSAIRLLNEESTLNSTTERGHLKNLGGWLGSLTIARDKPIKHKNIYFKDLLIEAFDSQRLMVVIPFTCKVLVQATKSTVFKPPNPWLMDILALLMEIYHYAELKMILKFEIEVLCGDLELDHKTIEPSTYIRERPSQLEDGIPSASMPEGLEGFEDMSLTGMTRSIGGEKMSNAAIISSLPDLDRILVLPPSANTMVDPTVLRQVVVNAVQRAILEIITPVVERSITIASISTGQLILKDFAMEPDEEKVRQAAGTMVRSLAGSLALVTCKEPLKMSMTNYIRAMQADFPDQPMPEGLILMCVNDNLDTACSIVEKAAEERSLPEIEKVIENQLEARRQHRLTRPNDPFIDASISRWGFFIPAPYRQMPGGLNKEQLAIYEDFARQSRGAGQAHLQTASTDSGKQMDALQESFPAIPNLSTPKQPAVPHQPQEAGMQQPVMAAAQPNLNGLLESAPPREKMEGLISQLQQAARANPDGHVKDLGRDSSILLDYNLILRTILAAPNGEDLARMTAFKICSSLYSHTEGNLEIVVLVHLLSKVWELSPHVARYTWALLADVNDEHMFNVPVTVALIDAGLMDLHRVDMILTKLIQERNTAALDLLSDLINRVLLNEEPSALRSDFAGSLDAMSAWYLEDPKLQVAGDIIQRLRESGIPEFVSPLLNDVSRSKRDQMEYIFSEWIGVYKFSGGNDRTASTFLKDLHQRQVMNTQEDSALFFRLSIDLSVAIFEHEAQNPNGSQEEAFLYIDALAKLVILLVKFQGESDGAVKASKPVYLNSILSLLVLTLNHHQVMRGENFNQRVFFRLFSSILCEYNFCELQNSDQHKDMMLAFAERFMSLQPKHAPGFVYGWLALVSHRYFMAPVLELENQSGWQIYCEIMQAMLAYIGEQLKPAQVTFVAKDMYKGIVRILLILHHDYPEFVAENHFQLCNVIPSHCPQIRNLVLSAYPSSFQKLPDPFKDGLKIDRLEEIRMAPKITGDLATPLQNANIKGTVDSCLRATASDVAVQQICDAITNPSVKETGLFFDPINVDVPLVNAIVLYVGQSAVASPSSKGTPVFSNLPQSTLLDKVAKALHPEARYFFLSAVANQLRYPNSHTHYFSYIILNLFGSEQSERSEIREQIVRVLLERLIVHRPHPWGLIVTLQELLQNSSYAFFRLPFIQAAPEIGRLFDALLQHIQHQSPRTMAS